MEPAACPQDCQDTDTDGWVDSVDNCPDDWNVNQEDADLDEAGDACDCQALEALLWGTPSEVVDLIVSQDGLTWQAPAAPGSTSWSYDVLRSGEPWDFLVGAACLADPDPFDRALPAPPDPPLGAIYFYLVRARNDCPVPLGYGDLGQGRSGIACP
jgi:hypothetical protein